MVLGILGHRGFIGSNLMKLFSSKGFSVFPLFIGDYKLGITWKKVLEDLPLNLDFIIHAAGSANVSDSFLRPSYDFANNTQLVSDFLDALRTSRHKNACYLFLSSAAVYGEPDVLPITSLNPVCPLSPYGYHKAMSEMLVKSFSQCFGIRGISLRIFSAYGEGNRKQVLWELCKKSNSSVDSTIFVEGTGNESRDFIHVNDIVNQILLLMQNASFNGEVYNVANGVEISIRDLATIIADEFQISKIEFNRDIRTGYPQRWIADISCMINYGYYQQVNFIDGVRAYCNWFKTLKHND